MTRRTTTTTSTLPRNPSSSVLVIFLAVSAALAALRALDRGHDRQRERSYSYTYDSRRDKARSNRARSRSRSRSHMTRRRSMYDHHDGDHEYHQARRVRYARRASAPAVHPAYSDLTVNEYEAEPMQYITDGRGVPEPQGQLTWNDDDRTLVDDRDSSGSESRVVLYRGGSGGRNVGSSHREREHVYRERHERRR